MFRICHIQSVSQPILRHSGCTVKANVHTDMHIRAAKLEPVYASEGNQWNNISGIREPSNAKLPCLFKVLIGIEKSGTMMHVLYSM